MTRPLASVSLDLDNQWSYMKTHGDAGWESLPSYFDRLMPRLLDAFGPRGWRVTFFVVGLDCRSEANRAALRRLADAGHEFGNHSFRHEPWLHRYTRSELEQELAQTEDAIETATGMRPRGFRGPGFSWSTPLLEILRARGYEYDASTLPTWIGPLARRYYFWRSRLSSKDRETRQQLFGGVSDMWRPVRPYRWRLSGGTLLEIPVTTVPWLRVPFHLSYVLYLSTWSWTLARLYLRMSLQLCRACGVEPSLLLHPLDFLGGDEVPELAFFPAMSMSGTVKRSRAAACLDMLGSSFEVVSLGEHAKRIAARKNLRERTPDAPGPDESGGAATDIATSAPLDTRMVEPRLTVENRRESGARNAS